MSEVSKVPEDDPLDEGLAPVPVGEYRLAFWPMLLRAGVVLGLGVALLLAAIFGLPAASVFEEILIGTMAGVLGVLGIIGAGGLIYRLGGEPRLNITEEGIRIFPDSGLRVLLPFLGQPEPEFIPWAEIESIEPGAFGSVILGYPESGWKRFLPRRADLPPGRLLPLVGLDVPAEEIKARLLFWSSEKGVLEVRRAKLLEAKASDPAKDLPDGTERGT